MKLLICDKCEDIIKLRRGIWRSCECGHVRARYEEDGRYAEWNGLGALITLKNAQLAAALKARTIQEGETRPEFGGTVIPVQARNVRVVA